MTFSRRRICLAALLSFLLLSFALGVLPLLHARDRVSKMEH